MIVKGKRRIAGKAHNVLQKTWVLTKDIKEKRNTTENKEERNRFDDLMGYIRIIKLFYHLYYQTFKAGLYVVS